MDAKVRVSKRRPALELIDQRHAGRLQGRLGRLPDVSRRAFLGVAFSSPLAGVAAAEASIRPVRIEKIGRRVVFVRHGQALFTVDPRAFAPAGPGLVPSVTLTRREDGEIVTLRHALVRGSRMPVELTIKIWRKPSRSTVEFNFLAQGWSLRAGLDDWISGAVPASGKAPKAAPLARDEALQVHLQRGARIALGRDWGLAASGPRCGVVQSAQGVYEADAIGLCLADEKPQDARGTQVRWIGLRRGRNRWPMTLATGLPFGAKLAPDGAGFDTIDVELSVARDGRRTAAVKISASDEAESWRFAPGPAIRRIDADDGAIKLVGLRQVSLFDKRGHHALTLANFAPEPQLLLAGGVTLTAGPARRHAVEIEALNGERTRLRVAPTLVSYQLPLDQSAGPNQPGLEQDASPKRAIGFLGQGLIATTRVPAEASINILFDTEPCPADRGSCSVSASAEAEGVHFCELSTTILRPSDMLQLTFVFEGFVLARRDGEARLYPRFPPNRDAWNQPRLKVVFPSPQHLSETAVIQQTPTFDWKQKVPPGYLHQALLFKPERHSQLVFDIPEYLATRGIPCRLESFLDWRDFQPRVVANALPERGSGPPLLPAHWHAELPCPTPLSEPRDGHFTAIRVANFVDLSPHKWSTWRHAIEPVRLPSKGVEELGDRKPATQPAPHELWHTQLDVYRGGELDPAFGRLRPVPVSGLRPDLKTVRAIWSEDYHSNTTGDVCLSANAIINPNPLPDKTQAAMIVSQSADLTCNPDLKTDPQSHLPIPPSKRAAPFDRLMLSSQGATVRLDARWDPSALTEGEIDEWKQDSVWGRDQDVLISYRGYGDHGHRISYIIERVREIVPDRDGGFTAALVEHHYCRVDQRIVYFDPPQPGSRVEGRGWPYTKVEIATETLRTPDLNIPPQMFAGLPKSPAGPSLHGDPKDPCDQEPDAFIMIPAGTSAPFLFKVIYTDLNGATHVEHRPFLWINVKLAETRRFQGPGVGGTTIENIVDAYRASGLVDGVDMTRFRKASTQHAKITAAIVPPVENPNSKFRPPKMDPTVEVRTVTTSLVVSDPCNVSQSTWRHKHDASAILAWPKADLNNDWPGVIDWPLRFYPTIDAADVRLQNIDLAGAADSASGDVSPSAQTLARVSFSDDLRAYGLPVDKTANSAALLFDIHDPKPGFKLPGGRSAGVVVPASTIAHYSASLGPVGAPNASPPGAATVGGQSPGPPVFTFSANLFSDAALICGAVKISDVIGDVGDVFDVLAKVPQFVSEALDDIDSIRQQATAAKAALDALVATVKTVSDLKGLVLAAASAAQSRVLDQINLYLFGTTDPTPASIANTTRGIFYENIAKPVEAYYAELAQRQLFAVNASYADAVAQVQQDLHIASDTAEELYANTLTLAASYNQALAEAISWTPWVQALRTRASAAFQLALSQLTDAGFGAVEALLDDLSTFQRDLGNPAKLLGTLPGLLDRADVALATLQTRATSLTADQIDKIATSTTDAIATAPDSALKALAANVAHILAAAMVGARPSDALVATNPNDDYPTLAPPDLKAAPKILRKAVLGTAVALIDLINDPRWPIFPPSPRPLDGMRQALVGDLTNLPSAASLETDLNATAIAAQKELTSYVENRIAAALLTSNIQQLLRDALAQQGGLASFCNTLAVQINNQPVATLATQLHARIQKVRDLIAEATAAVPQQIKLHYDWSPPLQSGPGSNPIFVARYGSEPATCDLHVEITKTVLTPDFSVSNSPPEINASCTLANFSIVLLPSLPMITVGFKSISFVSHNGGSPSVDVKFGRIELSSELSFVTALEEYFLGDAPVLLDIQTNQIAIGYGLQLPNMTLGGMNIMQLAFYVSVILPFDRGPTRARFAVSERNHPFLLSVGIYGGGGYFAIEATPQGIQAMEASLEFGGVAAVTVGGVASGIAYALGGIYFRDEGGDVTLTGFFDAGGNFDIIGLIQLNIDFYVGLTYHNGDAFGEVMVCVEIGFTFFSITVHIHQTKTIAGSGARSGGRGAPADPVHADLLGVLDHIDAKVPPPNLCQAPDDEGQPAPSRNEILAHWNTWRKREMAWPQ